MKKDRRRRSKQVVRKQTRPTHSGKVICENSDWESGPDEKEGLQISMKLASLTAEDGCLHFLIFPVLTTSLICLTCLASFCLFLLIMESLLGKCYTFSFAPQILHFPFLTPPPPQFLKNLIAFQSETFLLAYLHAHGFFLG